jgi:uncharacterized membrane protein
MDTPAATANQPQLVLAVFDDRAQAEAAVRALHERGFTSERISVLFRHDVEISAAEAVALDREAESTSTAVALGSTVGGLAGLLGGLAAFSIPGIGPLLGVGVLATTLGGAALGAVAGERATHFKELGVPDDRSERYGAALESGGVVLAISAHSADEVMQARETLATQRADEIDVHPQPSSMA